MVKVVVIMLISLSLVFCARGHAVESSAAPGAAAAPAAADAVAATAVAATVAILTDDAAQLRPLLEPGGFQSAVEQHWRFLELQGRPPRGGTVHATVLGRRTEVVESLSYWFGKGGPSWAVTMDAEERGTHHQYEIWLLKESGKVSGFNGISATPGGKRR